MKERVWGGGGGCKEDKEFYHSVSLLLHVLFSFGKGAWNLAGERIDGELELRGLFFFPFRWW